MEFFNSAVDVLKTLVVALGAGLGVWGAVNLMEGYGGDNPSAKSQGMKQIGRASCRERVEISGGAGSLKKKKIDYINNVPN